MPPSRGMAPPESPVPAPRPVSGSMEFAREADDGGDIFGGARKDDEIGAVFIDAAIVFVEGKVFRAIEDVALAEEGEKARRDARRGHGISVAFYGCEFVKISKSR